MIEELLNTKLNPKEVLKIKADDEDVLKLIRELNLINPGASTFAEIREQNRREIEYFYYAVYRGYSEGLRDAALISFASVISGLLGGMSVSFSTDAYFNEMAIENRAIDQYNLLVDAGADHLTVARGVVEYLLKEYEDPEPAMMVTKNVVLTKSLVNKVSKEEGKSFSEKLRNVLDDYFRMN